MNIIIAPDSFKGSLTAPAAALAIERGIRRVLPDARCWRFPVGDGGEGTAACLAEATGGRLERVVVSGPLGEPVEAAYAVLGGAAARALAGRGGLAGPAHAGAAAEGRGLDSDGRRDARSGDGGGLGGAGCSGVAEPGASGGGQDAAVAGPDASRGQRRWSSAGASYADDDPQRTDPTADTVCVIEMAAASGLGLVPPARRNPLLTTTFGTGQLIRAALDRGCRRFVLALGGSATTDGGAGMLQALGMRLLDSAGRPVGCGGAELARIVTIDDTGFDTRIADSEWLIATDVSHPLIGAQGAARVFGPQKGASPQAVEALDAALRHWADRIAAHNGVRLHDQPGAGAAGGLGGAFQAFFPARQRRGIDVVIELIGLERHLAGAALVFTGEGRIDAQTAAGKAPLGIAQAAKRHGVPVLALAGSVGDGVSLLHEHGISSVHSIIQTPMSLEAAMHNAAVLLEQAAEQALRAFLAGRREQRD